MFESSRELKKIVGYMQAHWPSEVKKEWQVEMTEYPEILKRVLTEFTVDKTCGQKLVRVAGLSGSGKTTQLLPAAEAYFGAMGEEPVLVAARRFVEYHPHYTEILDFYGEENLRKMTDEFATVMMFLTISELTKNKYDIILDVALLDPEMESILLRMMNANEYEKMLMMIAISPEMAEKHLRSRNWRHTKETEQEFIRAMEKAMRYYVKNVEDMRTVIWNTYEKEPVYDGPVKESLTTFTKCSAMTKVPRHNPVELLRAKIEYLTVDLSS